MPTQKLVNRNIRKLSRTGSGGSLCVTIPVDIVAKLKWKDHQKVVVKKVPGGIIVKDWKNR